MKKRRSIAKLYKPTYIEDKKDIEMIDHYIKLEGRDLKVKYSQENLIWLNGE